MSGAAQTPAPYPLRLDSRAWSRALSGIVVALLLIHMAFQLNRFNTHWTPWQLQALFDVDQEQSVPTWYSSLALAFAALLLRAIATARRRDGSREAGPWGAMSWIMLFLSLDEVGGIHETVNSLAPITWTIPFGLLTAAVAAAFLPFILRLHAETRRDIILSGIVFVAGAAGIELITSQFYGESNKRQLLYALITPFEEGLEMFGIVILIRSLLRLMERESAAAARVTIEVPPASGA